jgi:ribosomal protein RSM22 (predicted rRNA methylase)
MAGTERRGLSTISRFHHDLKSFAQSTASLLLQANKKDIKLSSIESEFCFNVEVTAPGPHHMQSTEISGSPNHRSIPKQPFRRKFVMSFYFIIYVCILQTVLEAQRDILVWLFTETFEPHQTTSSSSFKSEDVVVEVGSLRPFSVSVASRLNLSVWRL